MSKSTVILLCVLFIFCLIFVFWGLWLVFFSTSSPPSATVPSPEQKENQTKKPGQSNYPSDQYITGVIRIQNSRAEKAALEKAGDIIRFRESLPYKTLTFFLSYDIDTNTYKAVIRVKDRNTGDADVKKYLETFRLKDSDVSLITTYQ